MPSWAALRNSSAHIARTGDGRARAKARGVKFGRPPSLTPHQRQEAIQQLAEGTTQADLARTYGVSQATISRLHPLYAGKPHVRNWAGGARSTRVPTAKFFQACTWFVAVHKSPHGTTRSTNARP